MTKPKPELTTAEIEERLQKAGINPTAQRIAIYRYILCEADHPTAEDVKAWADANFPKLSLATVYNTLGALVKAGLLQEFKLPHTDSVIYDDRLDDHFHFLDEDSGELVDIPLADLPLDKTELARHLGAGFQIRDMHVLFRGRRAG